MSKIVKLPAFVDMHVHLREPGFTEKETLETGMVRNMDRNRNCKTTVSLMILSWEFEYFKSRF